MAGEQRGAVQTEASEPSPSHSSGDVSALRAKGTPLSVRPDPTSGKPRDRTSRPAGSPFTSPTPAAQLLERFGISHAAAIRSTAQYTSNAPRDPAARVSQTGGRPRSPVAPPEGKEPPWTPNGPNDTHVPYMRVKMNPLFADLLDDRPPRVVRAVGAAGGTGTAPPPAWRPGGAGGTARTGAAAGPSGGGYVSRAAAATAARARATSRQTTAASTTAPAAASSRTSASSGGTMSAAGADTPHAPLPARRPVPQRRGPSAAAGQGPGLAVSPRLASTAPSRALRPRRDADVSDEPPNTATSGSTVSTPTASGPGRTARVLSYSEWVDSQRRSPGLAQPRWRGPSERTPPRARPAAPFAGRTGGALSGAGSVGGATPRTPSPLTPPSAAAGGTGSAGAPRPRLTAAAGARSAAAAGRTAPPPAPAAAAPQVPPTSSPAAMLPASGFPEPPARESNSSSREESISAANLQSFPSITTLATGRLRPSAQLLPGSRRDSGLVGADVTSGFGSAPGSGAGGRGGGRGSRAAAGSDGGIDADGGNGGGGGGAWAGAGAGGQPGGRVGVEEEGFSLPEMEEYLRVVHQRLTGGSRVDEGPAQRGRQDPGGGNGEGGGGGGPQTRPGPQPRPAGSQLGARPGAYGTAHHTGGHRANRNDAGHSPQRPSHQLQHQFLLQHEQQQQQNLQLQQLPASPERRRVPEPANSDPSASLSRRTSARGGPAGSETTDGGMYDDEEDQVSLFLDDLVRHASVTGTLLYSGTSASGFYQTFGSAAASRRTTSNSTRGVGAGERRPPGLRAVRSASARHPAAATAAAAVKAGGVRPGLATVPGELPDKHMTAAAAGAAAGASRMSSGSSTPITARLHDCLPTARDADGYEEGDAAAEGRGGQGPAMAVGEVSGQPPSSASTMAVQRSTSSATFALGLAAWGAGESRGSQSQERSSEERSGSGSAMAAAAAPAVAAAAAAAAAAATAARAGAAGPDTGIASAGRPASSGQNHGSGVRPPYVVRSFQLGFSSEWLNDEDEGEGVARKQEENGAVWRSGAAEDQFSELDPSGRFEGPPGRAAPPPPTPPLSLPPPPPPLHKDTSGFGADSGQPAVLSERQQPQRQPPAPTAAPQSPPSQDLQQWPPGIFAAPMPTSKPPLPPGAGRSISPGRGPGGGGGRGMYGAAPNYLSITTGLAPGSGAGERLGGPQPLSPPRPVSQYMVRHQSPQRQSQSAPRRLPTGYGSKAAAAAALRSSGVRTSHGALESRLSAMLSMAGLGTAGGGDGEGVGVGGGGLRGSISGASNFSALSGPQAGVMYNYPSHGYMERAAEFGLWEAAMLYDLDLYDSLQLQGFPTAEEYDDPTYVVPSLPGQAATPLSPPATGSTPPAGNNRPVGALAAADGGEAASVAAGVTAPGLPEEQAAGAALINADPAEGDDRPASVQQDTALAGRSGRPSSGAPLAPGLRALLATAPGELASPEAAGPAGPLPTWHRARSLSRVLQPRSSRSGSPLRASSVARRQEVGGSTLNMLDQILHEEPQPGWPAADADASGAGAQDADPAFQYPPSTDPTPAYSTSTDPSSRGPSHKPGPGPGSSPHRLGPPASPSSARALVSDGHQPATPGTQPVAAAPTSPAAGTKPRHVGTPRRAAEQEGVKPLRPPSRSSSPALPYTPATNDRQEASGLVPDGLWLPTPPPALRPRGTPGAVAAADSSALDDAVTPRMQMPVRPHSSPMSQYGVDPVPLAVLHSHAAMYSSGPYHPAAAAAAASAYGQAYPALYVRGGGPAGGSNGRGHSPSGWLAGTATTLPPTIPEEIQILSHPLPQSAAASTCSSAADSSLAATQPGAPQQQQHQPQPLPLQQQVRVQQQQQIMPDGQQHLLVALQSQAVPVSMPVTLPAQISAPVSVEAPLAVLPGAVALPLGAPVVLRYDFSHAHPPYAVRMTEAAAAAAPAPLSPGSRQVAAGGHGKPSAMRTAAAVAEAGSGWAVSEPTAAAAPAELHGVAAAGLHSGAYGAPRSTHTPAHLSPRSGRRPSTTPSSAPQQAVRSAADWPGSLAGPPSLTPTPAGPGEDRAKLACLMMPSMSTLLETSQPPSGMSEAACPPSQARSPEAAATAAAAAAVAVGQTAADPEAPHRVTSSLPYPPPSLDSILRLLESDLPAPAIAAAVAVLAGSLPLGAQWQDPVGRQAAKPLRRHWESVGGPSVPVPAETLAMLSAATQPDARRATFGGSYGGGYQGAQGPGAASTLHPPLGMATAAGEQGMPPKALREEQEAEQEGLAGGVPGMDGGEATNRTGFFRPVGPLGRAVGLLAQSMLIVLAGAAGATAAASSANAIFMRPEDLPYEHGTSIYYYKQHHRQQRPSRH